MHNLYKRIHLNWMLNKLDNKGRIPTHPVLYPYKHEPNSELFFYIYTHSTFFFIYIYTATHHTQSLIINGRLYILPVHRFSLQNKHKLASTVLRLRSKIMGETAIYSVWMRGVAVCCYIRISLWPNFSLFF